MSVNDNINNEIREAQRQAWAELLKNPSEELKRAREEDCEDDFKDRLFEEIEEWIELSFWTACQEGRAD